MRAFYAVPLESSRDTVVKSIALERVIAWTVLEWYPLSSLRIRHGLVVRNTKITVITEQNSALCKIAVRAH